MLLPTLLWKVLSLLLLASAVLSSPLGDEDAPLLEITASFPEDNPFGQVVNGERNKINLLIENHSGQNVTLMTAGGSFHHPDSNALIKNASTLSYGIFLMEGTKTQIPYTFHSEFKAGDLKLRIWLNYLAETTVYQALAYDSTVTIVEPDVSMFHYQVLSTYAITLAFVGGLSYFAYVTFFPQGKKSRRSATSPPSKTAISAPVGKVTATGTGGYEEEWIPDHHLKKTRSGKRKEGAASSGDESGVEPNEKKKGKK